MKTFFRLLLAAALGYLVLPGGAWAGPVWSLQWEFGSNVLISDSGRSAVLFSPHYLTTGSATSSTSVIARVGEYSYAPPWPMDRITRQNYGMLLKLTDMASHASRYFWFAGSLTGTISQHTSNLTNHFFPPTSYANVRLGRDIYNIGIGPFYTPSWGNHFNGTIFAHVGFQPVVTHPHTMGSFAAVAAPMGVMGAMTTPPGGAVSPTPEPSSLILGGLGLALAVPVWWRRRRQIA